ncbi:spermatogenesis-associated protein 45 [Protobothrops mucrosquamatus]|uniref:spermatogenesis-associated protein 45 n=1 Tax=Protobothrops mucrosquamatus TaxID=103944 RepID=UPI000775E48E|nr:spermatogenesis-associated protein 45 [Protobothrops mucrosquamatus]XP_015671441.1 spermatogenesis-associated protein 45 [Protobothrops mucrosquamatus]XP_015671442.1 spermatogenesis-associated protein 45 [Protobothrops mucrosquamatus]XP_015671443.1 spermatogenesis-associated protein 45 [Protobothrops mucrosquamatus]
MAEDEKRQLLEYNQMRESRCLLEGKSETSWLRPQKKHFPQSNQASAENYKEEKKEDDSGRTSWIKITPSDHKEKRHFPEKNNAIFG